MFVSLLIIAFVLAFWAAFQLQIITIFPNMGLWSVHNFEPKRWLLRLASANALVATYWQGDVPNWALGFIILTVFLLFMSFIIDNTKGFKALDPQFVTHYDSSHWQMIPLWSVLNLVTKPQSITRSNSWSSHAI